MIRKAVAAAAAVLIASSDASGFHYGLINGVNDPSDSLSMHGSVRLQLEEARSKHWSNQVRGTSSSSASLSQNHLSLRKLQATDSGFLVASQFSSSSCESGSLEYSAVYHLGSCVISSGTSSYMYSGYEGNGANFQVTYSTYSDDSCSALTENSILSYSSGCTDSVVYAYIPTAAMVPEGVMFAYYNDEDVCLQSGSDFYFATVVPFSTCYNGYQYATCSATSMTYCRNDICPTPLPTVSPTRLPTAKPTALPSPLPTRVPISSPTSAPIAVPTSKPSLSPSPPPSASPVASPTSAPTSLAPVADPTQSPTKELCGCGTYFDESTDSCAGCPVDTFFAGRGATSAASCLPCSLGTFSFSGACQCSSTPEPIPNPTARPSTHPTAFPIALPTPLPTSPPSAIPTTLPSKNPTQTPSLPPSKAPTYLPIAQPTDLPTTEPTTAEPTFDPTFSPIANPTSFPIAHPTFKPIASPTLSPTYAPCGCGSYLDSNTGQCAPCPAGTFSPFPNAVDSSTCSICPNGKESTAGSCICQSVPTSEPTRTPTTKPSASPSYISCQCGSYLDVSTDSCAECAANTYSGADSLACTACPEGSFSVPGACSCASYPTLRPISSPSAAPVALSTLSPVSPPTLTPTDPPTPPPTLAPTSQILYCPCGKYFVSSVSTCELCPPGTYSPLPGTVDGCFVCPPGLTSDLGSCSCSAAPSTAPTPEPTYKLTSEPISTPTLVPTLSPIANPTSSPIPVPTLTPTWVPFSNPTKMPIGTPTEPPSESPTPSPTSEVCSCGYYMDNGVCSPCEAEYFNSYSGATSSSWCEPCPLGSFSPAGSCFCVGAPTVEPSAVPTLTPSANPTPHPVPNPIAVPTLAPTGSPLAIPTAFPLAVPSATPSVSSCGCGYFFELSSSSCKACAAGTYMPFSELTAYGCITCADGLSSYEASCSCSIITTTEPTPEPTPFAPTLFPTAIPTTSTPISLPTHIVNPPTSKPVSEACPCGSYMSFEGICTQCAVDTYSLAGASSIAGCLPCPAKTYSHAGSCSCLSVPTIEPTPIPTTKPSSLSPSALPTYGPCPCGSYGNAIDGCTLCAAGSYTSYPGLPACFICPSGYTSGPGSCTCKEMPTSLPTAIPTALPTVTPCPCGTYLSAESTCELCAAGSYTPEGFPTTPACFACPSGYTSDTGACSCYVSPTALPSSAPLANPTSEPFASPTAEPFADPTAFPTRFPLALPTEAPFVAPSHMPIGTPTDSPSFPPSASPTWTPCPCGTFVNEENGSCVQCPAGLYSPGTGAVSISTCVACPAGYAATADACFCVVIPVASPTPVPSTAPTLHPTGFPIATPTNFFSSSPTASPTLYPISRPTLTPSTAPIAFPTVKPSTFAPTYAPCACGTYSLGVNGECQVCPAGTYMPYTGLEGCFVCPPGYTSNPGSCTSCYLAPTALPTAPPTDAPFSAPPIAAPTGLPVTAPIAQPTSYPISKPTAAPTDYPISLPTPNPTYVSCGCGSYLNTATNSCILCGVDTYSLYTDAIDASFCSTCPNGMFSGVGACTCIPEPSAAPVSLPTPVPSSLQPSAHPTLAPTILEYCSIIPYTRCGLQSGAYVSTTCSINGGVYEADDKIESSAFAGFELPSLAQSASSFDALVVGIAVSAITVTVFWACGRKKLVGSKEERLQYMQLSVHEREPFQTQSSYGSDSL